MGGVNQFAIRARFSALVCSLLANSFLVSEDLLFDIVDNGRDAQAAVCRGGDGVLSITTGLVCLSHSSLCVTNYVSL